MVHSRLSYFLFSSIKNILFYSLFSEKKVLENQVIKVTYNKINPRCEKKPFWVTLLLGNFFKNKVTQMAYKVTRQ